MNKENTNLLLANNTKKKQNDMEQFVNSRIVQL